MGAGCVRLYLLHALLAYSLPSLIRHLQTPPPPHTHSVQIDESGKQALLALCNGELATCSVLPSVACGPLLRWILSAPSHTSSHTTTRTIHHPPPLPPPNTEPNSIHPVVPSDGSSTEAVPPHTRVGLVVGGSQELS